MVEVEKREKDTSEGLIRRFTRQLQQSKILPQARKNRFFSKKKTRAQLREDAMYKQKVKKEVDKYKKMGVFDDDKLKDIKKRIGG